MCIRDSIYSIALKKISIRDFKYQSIGNVDWEKQNYLDSLNRISLDSLFEIYGFPSEKVLEYSGNSRFAWFVLQHSSDCKWNEKWIERFLDAETNGVSFSSVPIFATFNRFYHPESGSCKDKDGEAFIKRLNQKYSSDLAEKYGYKYFYK